MTQTPLNIFDLLIADIHATGANQAAVATSIGGEETGIFDEIIRRYLGENGGVDVAAKGICGAARAVASMTPSMTPGLLGMAGTTRPEAAPKSEDMLAWLPQRMTCWSDNIRDLMTVDTAELSPGKYEIVSSRVDDGRLYLEITGQEPGSEKIRMNLPVDSLQLLNSSPAQRVRLGVDAYEQTRLENLISKLNLKEIDVQTIDYSKAATAEEPIEVALTADGTAGEIILRGKLDRNRMRLFANEPEPALKQRNEISNLTRSQTVETQKARHRGTGEGRAAKAWDKNPTESLFGEGKILSGNAKADTQMGMRTPLTAKDLFDGWKWQMQTSKGSDMAKGAEGFFGLDAVTAKGEVVGKTGDSQMVRFYLPDNIQTALRPNGSAVTIRLEPDALGPARLSLVISNERLRARIAVESPAAKTILESNLDRLIEQLAKADIQVEHIEITISGDSARNHYFGKQPHWRHRVVSRQISLDGVPRDGKNTAGALPPAGPAQWVGASGVNLLA